MSAKVIPFSGITTLDMPAEHVLRGAIERDLEGVVVLGYDKDGGEYMASSYADGGTVLWLLERCKARLMESHDC